MTSEVNQDYRAAHRVLTGFKIVLTGLAALVMLVGVYTVWREAFGDQDGAGVAAQGLVGTMVTVVGVGVAWAVLMLPVWLLSGFTSKRV